MNKTFALVALSTLTSLLPGCYGGPVPGDDPSTAVSAIQVSDHNVSRLCVGVSDVDGAGTTNDIELNYLTSSNDFWSCTIHGGVARAQTQCCSSQRTYKKNTYTFNVESFYVQFTGDAYDDGLRVGSVTAYTGAGNITIEHFEPEDSVIYANGCSGLWNDENCSSFWLDTSGHRNCTAARITADDRSLYCIHH